MSRARAFELLMARVEPEPNSGCWLWTGGPSSEGYSRVWDNDLGGCVTGHVLVYETLIGPVPDGLELDHLCRVRICVRPSHLEPVTHQVNVLRGESITVKWANRTTCVRDHPLDGVRGNGKRYCKQCARDWVGARRRRATSCLMT